MGKRKLTFEEVKAEFEKRGYELLETEYMNANTKMRYKCPKHPNKELSTKVRNLKSGRGCPYCGRELAIKNCTITIAQAQEEFTNRGYIPLFNERPTPKAKLSYRCPKHPDKNLSIRLSGLKSGKGCPYCGGKVKLSIQEVYQEFVNRGYTPLFEEYKNSHEKLPYTCPNHPDKPFLKSFTQFKNYDSGCPYCANMIALNKARHEFVKRGYIPLFDQYINVVKKLKYQCPKHPDKDLSVSLANLKNGNSCPYCILEQTQSKGCTKIESFLKTKNVQYKKEQKFPDCKNRALLRFDFAIYSSELLQFIIEFDGLQHFRSSKSWGGEQALKETQLRDRIKNEYCLKNNIPLYRIRYDQINEIESILEEILRNHCVNF